MNGKWRFVVPIGMKSKQYSAKNLARPIFEPKHSYSESASLYHEKSNCPAFGKCGAERGHMNKISQNKKILEHLQSQGTITSLDAINKYGITRLSGRIFDLREQGHPIAKRMITVKNRFGEECRVAEYSLVVSG